MTRHSREDALTEPQFERLWNAAQNLDERWRLECEFVVVVAGRLGLRAGELCHMTENWINWDRRQIEIPQHDPCDHGKDGGICGYCRDRASVMADTKTEQNLDEIYSSDDLEYHEPGVRVTPDLFVEPEEMYHRRWEPKTEQGHRVVPFGFDPEIEQVIEEFFMFNDAFEPSRSAVNRRVDRALEAAGFPKSLTYPHALRATSASWHAHRGLNPTALQSLHGWARLSTSQKYIRLSGSQTSQALNEAHAGD